MVEGGGEFTERRCRRFRVDGTRCTNETDLVDRWCRQPGCPGYVRPSMRPPSPPKGVPGKGSRWLLRHNGAVRPIPTELMQGYDSVTTTYAARESYRATHGGSATEAAGALRSIVEDFVLGNVLCFSDSTGYFVLTHRQYSLLFDPSGATVIRYATEHRERTWAQVKAGVRSRTQSRPSSGARPNGRGTPLAHSQLLSNFDPELIHVPGPVRVRFAKLMGRATASEADLERELRKQLRRLQNEGVIQAQRARDYPVVLGEYVWLLRGDGRVVSAVARHPAAAEQA
jgi:hypothetical protein